MKKSLLLGIFFCISVRLFSAEVIVTGRGSLIYYQEFSGQDSVKPKHSRGFFSLLHHFYKANLSEQLSSNCEFEPSCSVFSKQAIEKFGVFKGIFLTTDRLTRCNGNASADVPIYFTDPLHGKIIDRPEFYKFKPLEREINKQNPNLSFGRKRSAMIAGCLSAIIPGSGKYYLGAPSQATTSLIMNAFLGGAAAELLFKNKNPYLSTGAITLFSMFYFGNIWGTISLAHKQQQDIYREQLLRQELKNAYKQPLLQKSSLPSTEIELMNFIQKAINEKDYSIAYQLLLKLPDSIKNSSRSVQNAWLISLAGMNRFNECKEKILILSDTTKSINKDIRTLPINIQYKSPARASLLSAIIPGLGQVYTGHPSRGIISLALQSACVAIAVTAFTHELYFAGIVFGIYPFLRFYSGGKLNARSLAQQYNEQKERDLKEKYLMVIERFVLQLK